MANASAIRRKRLGWRRRGKARGGERDAEDAGPASPKIDGHTHFCYALATAEGWDAPSAASRGRTYVGYTVDPRRRLRQHNGEIKGGARRTAAVAGWRFLFVVTVADTDVEIGAAEGRPRFGAHEGLSLEWHLKTGRGRGKSLCRQQRQQLRGPELRIAMLREALSLPKFRGFARRFTVFVDDRYVDDVWAALIDVPDLLCAVLPLGQLIDSC